MTDVLLMSQVPGMVRARGDSSSYRQFVDVLKTVRVTATSFELTDGGEEVEGDPKVP